MTTTTETKEKTTVDNSGERAMKAHEENTAPTKELVKRYLSKTSGYYSTTSVLNRFVSSVSKNYGFESDARPNVGLLKHYSDVCTNLLALLSNPTVSVELDTNLHQDIGKQVLYMGEFMKGLAESKVVQAELDMFYLTSYYKGEEKVAPINKYYSKEIEVQDPDYEDDTFSTFN